MEFSTARPWISEAEHGRRHRPAPRLRRRSSAIYHERGTIMKFKGIVLASAFALLPLLPNRAEANTQFAISGQSCVGQNITNQYGALNTTGAALPVLCPTVINHFEQAFNVNAGVWDRNRTTNVSCTFYGKDNTTGDITFSSVASSTGSGFNVQQISSTTPPSTTSDYTVSCSVPAFDSGGPSGGVSGVSFLSIQTI
jgi:hypothetical protein